MLDNVGVFMFVLTPTLNFDKPAYNDTNAWLLSILISMHTMIQMHGKS